MHWFVLRIVYFWRILYHPMCVGRLRIKSLPELTRVLTLTSFDLVLPLPRRRRSTNLPKNGPRNKWLTNQLTNGKFRGITDAAWTRSNPQSARKLAHELIKITSWPLKQLNCWLISFEALETISKFVLLFIKLSILRKEHTGFVLWGRWSCSG